MAEVHGSVGTSPSSTDGKGAVAPPISWIGIGAGWSVEDLREHEGHCIVGLYNDGSGSVILYVGDGVLIDAEGDEHPWSFVPKQCSDVMRIPDSYQLWCECWDEDPYTLPRAPSEAPPPVPFVGEGLVPTEPNTSTLPANQGNP